MPLEIVTIPCLQDNYAYLLRDVGSGRVGLVDAPEAGPITKALDDRRWTLDLILITHHHSDHVDGLEPLRGNAEVVGAAADRHRLPHLDRAVAPGDTVMLGESAARVMDVPGHTIGHVAFYFPDAGALFSADSLMALGCGRLFEGTPEQMWESLSAMAALPNDTNVFSGHEYTASNARFALTVDPNNAELKARAEEIERLRAEGVPTVPSRLGLERATNPFLRASDLDIRDRLHMSQATDIEVFAEIRRLKDNF